MRLFKFPLIFGFALALLVGLTIAAAQPAPDPVATATPSPLSVELETVTPTHTLTPSPTRTRYTPLPTGTATLTPGPGNYVVKPGDRLLEIARMFGVTVSAIQIQNHLSSDLIYVGQVLAIPTPQYRTPTPTLRPGGQYYVVQEGDQLLMLARRFGVTLSSLKSANNLHYDIIHPGQILVIPPPAPTRTPIPPERLYTVQPGDQLLLIARQYGVTVSQIKYANGLKSDVIMVGQVLIIPTPKPPPATPRPPTPIPAGVTVHIVRRGDRLATLAVCYCVTIDAIKTRNGLSGDNIRIGQALVIPAPQCRPVAHVVRIGDTLVELAQQYNTTVETIKAANRIGADDIIYIGQTLMIPVR